MTTPEPTRVCTCHHTETQTNPDEYGCITGHFDWKWNPDCSFHKPQPTPIALGPCPYGNGDHRPLIRQAQAEERERIAAAIEAELLPDSGDYTYSGGRNDALRHAAHIARHSHEAPPC